VTDDEFFADDELPERRHPLRRAAATLIVLIVALSLIVWQVWPGASLLTQSVFRGWFEPKGLSASPENAIPGLVDAMQRGDAAPIEQAFGRRLASGEMLRLRAIVVPYARAGLASVDVGEPATAASGLVRYPVSVWSLNLYSVTLSVFVFERVGGRWYLRAVEAGVEPEPPGSSGGAARPV
jgi:hypothetical protein